MLILFKMRTALRRTFGARGFICSAIFLGLPPQAGMRGTFSAHSTSALGGCRSSQSLGVLNRHTGANDVNTYSSFDPRGQRFVALCPEIVVPSVQRHAAADIGGHVEIFTLVNGRLAFIESSLRDDIQGQLALTHF